MLGFGIYLNNKEADEEIDKKSKNIKSTTPSKPFKKMTGKEAQEYYKSAKL